MENIAQHMHGLSLVILLGVLSSFGLIHLVLGGASDDRKTHGFFSLACMLSFAVVATSYLLHRAQSGSDYLSALTIRGYFLYFTVYALVLFVAAYCRVWKRSHLLVLGAAPLMLTLTDLIPGSGIVHAVKAFAVKPLPWGEMTSTATLDLDPALLAVYYLWLLASFGYMLYCLRHLANAGAPRQAAYLFVVLAMYIGAHFYNLAGAVLKIPLPISPEDYAYALIIPAASFRLLQDFKAMKFQERKTNAERDRLAVAVEHVGEYIVITDADGLIQYVNPAFEKTLGYAMRDTIGRHVSSLKCGDQSEAFYRNIQTTLTQGRTWQGRLLSRHKNGSMLQIDATISPIFGAGHCITGFVSAQRDVTREWKLENHVREAQRLEALGTLTAGIAHDFNNILGSIMGTSGLLMKRLRSGSKEHQLATNIERAAERASALTAKLFDFSRQHSTEMKTGDLRAVVGEVAELIQATAPTNVRVENRMAPCAVGARYDEHQIHRLVMNLCVNGLHAMAADGGRLQISVDAQQADVVASSLPDSELMAATYAVITVMDSGCGIAASDLPHIFEPYFTTRREGEGTGLGLAVLHGIVKSHHGHVLVDTDYGEGTTFRVYLPGVDLAPRKEDVAAATSRPALPVYAPSGRESTAEACFRSSVGPLSMPTQ